MIFGNGFIVFPDGDIMVTESGKDLFKDMGLPFEVVTMVHPDGRRVVTDDKKLYESLGFKLS